MSKIVDRIFNTVLTANDSTAQEELGAFRFEDGNIYKYVSFTDAVTALAGGPVVMNSVSSTVVTCDIDAGAGVGTIQGASLVNGAAGYYGWIQIYGVATVKISDQLTAGDLLFPCTTDNFWSVSKTDAPGIGFLPGARALMNYQTAADATITAFIRCL